VGIILSDMVGARFTVAPHGEQRTDRNVCATQGKNKRTAHRQECLCHSRQEQENSAQTRVSVLPRARGQQNAGATGGSRGGG
jgi:hypothetical protein